MRTSKRVNPITATLGLTVAALVAAGPTAAQAQKKPLDHSVYDGWNSIRGEALSDDGRWALYTVAPQDGDAELRVRATSSDRSHAVARGVSARFTADSRFAVFAIEPMQAAVDEARKAKKKPAEQPKDSLGILNLETGEITRAERVKSFAVPDDGAGWVAYLLEKAPAGEGERSDSTGAAPAREGAARAGGSREKAEGTTLVLRNLETGEERRFEDVVDYTFSKDGRRLAYTASNEEGSADGVYIVDTASGAVTTVLAGRGEYKQLAFDGKGEQVAFLSTRDDADAEQPLFTLYHWSPRMDGARAVAALGTAGVPAGWTPSENGRVHFSESGVRLYFGTAPKPLPELDEDTLPPADERVELDVWNWKDPYLQPMQLVQLEREKRRTYDAVVHLREGKVVQLATAEMPEVTVGGEGDADVAIGTSDLPYRQLISWDDRYADVYLVDVETGARELIITQHGGGPVILSPSARYAVWFDNQALGWLALDVQSGDVVGLTEEVPFPVHDELEDRPQPPGSYGAAGWTEGEDWFLVYDRYDIWATDPTGRNEPRNITEGVGRAENLRFRYVGLDPDRTAIDAKAPLLLSAFDTRDKSAGFYRDHVDGDRRPERILMQDRDFSTPRKAEDADVVLYTRSSFEEFPDLWTSDLSFREPRRISDVNPQQADYLWGTAELVEWKSMDGETLQGILYKPENFDASKKYPMLVYFYERMSDGLHRYRTPVAGSSSISFSFYASRGYLVFVPDIPYRIGYPGESALHAVVPGVLELVKRGFVDQDAIGVQGHSWGGYQIAYMITKTNIFKAAEAGAPVANMVSAYGGIRWGSGMVRQFQYERTQSRLGGSLWETPIRFIENSPIFWADKVQTPLLMMHNDADGAVPWYQGIEYFTALRRLGKPVWMLNYNGEDHGLRQYHNRKDWAIRMQQFFDHHLKGAPAPVWMEYGVPAIEKGRTLGLELVTETAGVAPDGGKE